MPHEMVVERDWCIFQHSIGINDGKPCIMFEIDGDGRYLGQEKVIVLQDLCVGHGANEFNGTFWQECVIASVVACLSSVPREEFCKELGILWLTFYANYISCVFGRVMPVTDSHAVQLKVGEDQDKVITIQHCLELCLFQVGSKGNCSCCIDFNQHKLINKMVSKVQKMGDIGCYFCKIANSGQTCGSQAIRFNEDLGLS